MRLIAVFAFLAAPELFNLMVVEPKNGWSGSRNLTV